MNIRIALESSGGWSSGIVTVRARDTSHDAAVDVGGFLQLRIELR